MLFLLSVVFLVFCVLVVYDHFMLFCLWLSSFINFLIMK